MWACRTSSDRSAASGRGAAGTRSYREDRAVSELGAVAGGHTIVCPPVTFSASPVMYDASSEQRKPIALATSSGVS